MRLKRDFMKENDFFGELKHFGFAGAGSNSEFSGSSFEEFFTKEITLT